MQIESLKVFCDLAETESFTKAAQINEITQSAVSQQVSALERTFKALLIERSKKKFRLTREGEILYEYAKQIINQYDSLYNKLQDVVLPLYRDDRGRWIWMMKQSISKIGSTFTSHRMLRRYATEAYLSLNEVD